MGDLAPVDPFEAAAQQMKTDGLYKPVPLQSATDLPDQPQPTAVDGSDPFDAAAQQMKSVVQLPQNIAAVKAKYANPDQYQKFKEMSDKVGLDVGFVERNFPELEQQQRAKDVQDITSQNPELGQWYAQGDNPAAIKVDELRHLSGLSWLTASAVSAFDTGMDQVQFGKLSTKDMRGVATEDELAQADRLSNSLEPRTYGADSWLQSAWVTAAQQLPTIVQGVYESAKGGIAGFVGGAAAGAGTALVAGQLGPQVATPEEVVTVPGAALATGMWTGRAGALSAAYLYSFEQNAGPAYYEFKNMVDENGQKIDPNVARVAAYVTGALSGGLEVVGAEKLASLVPGASKVTGLFTKEAVKQALMQPSVRQAFTTFAKGVGEGALTEISTETAQQAVQIFAQEMAKLYSNKQDGTQFEPASAGDIAGQLLDTANQTAKAMVVLGPMLAGTRLGMDLKKANSAARDGVIMDSIAQTAQGDQLLKRLPEKGQDAVKAMMENGPVPNVYLQPEGIKTLFQSDEELNQFIDATGIRAQWDEASALGRDVVLPTEVFYSKIAAQPEVYQAMRPFMRLDPENFTQNDGEAFNEAWQNATQTLMGEHEQQMQADQKQASGVDAVAADVKQKAMDAGIVPDQAMQYAKLFAAFFGTMSQRTGLDPQELYQRYGFDINRALPGGTYKQVDATDIALSAVRNGHIPALRKQVETAKGSSLLDRISQMGGIEDVKGELAAVGLKGKRYVRKPRTGDMLGPSDNSHRPDAVVSQLQQEGYFPGLDNPTPNDLYDAIRQELGGQKIYSAQVQQTPDMAHLAGLVSFADMLDELGLDPARMTDEEIKAELARVTNADANSGAMFQEIFQSAGNTDTPEFHAWFDGSKVVDANGNPLMVYHGTQGSFESFNGIAWVTPDKELAVEYSDMGGFNGRPTGPRRVIAAYASIKNPFNSDLGLPSVLSFREFAVGAMDQAQEAGTLTREQADAVQAIISEVDAKNTASIEKHNMWNGELTPYTVRMLDALGFDGIEFNEDGIQTFGALRSEQIKDINNAGAFNPNDPRILFQGQKRGSIQLSPGRSVINLFDHANLSTFLHESGHFFLEVFKDLANKEGAGANFSLPGSMEIVDKGDGLHKRLQFKDTINNEGADPVDGSYGTSGITFYEQGNEIQIAGSYLPSSERGRGRGFAMYKALADYAQSEGKTLFSDGDVSADAVKVYDKLKAAGYDVEKSVSFREGSDAGFSGKFIGGTDEEGNKTDGFTIKINPKPQQKTAGLAEMWQATKEYLGITGDTIPEAAHEKFARTFEAYLMEGKAPSQEVAGIFARFRSWLIFVYKSVASLNVPINAKIRNVMDRLIATDDEIRAAQTAPEFRPQSALREFMTDAQWAAYEKTAANAVENAKRQMDERMMSDIRRETASEWRSAKAEIRTQVTDELSRQPVYEAMRYLRTGEWPGNAGPPERLHLSKDAILSVMGPGSLERLKGLYRVEGGVHPDYLAELFGFQSGHDMLTQMMSVPKLEDAVTAETNVRMKSRFGDLLGDANARVREAREAMTNDATGELLAKELEVAVRKGLVATSLRKEDAQRAAKNLIRNRPIREALRSKLYMMADSKAAQDFERAVLKGDWPAAVEAKQRQLVNHYMAQESVNARKDVESAVNYLNRFTGRKMPKGIDAEYFDQIASLIERFDLRRSVSNTEAQRRVKLSAWIQQQEDMGNIVQIPDQLRDDAFRKPYKSMTTEDLLGLRDTVKNIEHLGRLKDRLLANKEAREVGAAADELNASLAASQKARPAPKTRNPTEVEKVLSMLKSADASFLKMQQIFDWFDNGDINGPFNRLIWRPISEAEGKENGLQAKYTAHVAEIFGKLDPKRLNERVGASGVQESYARSEVIAMALNLGNESNLDKMRRGEGWDDATIKRLTDNLNADEWQAVGDTLKLVNSLWPEIKALQKRLTGVEPVAVEPRTIQTPFGDIEGGYFPMIYDPNRSNQVADRAAANTGKMFENTYVKPETWHGFTKERVQNYTRPLLFDLDNVGQHLISVIHDLTHREAIMDAVKLLAREDVRNEIQNRYGREIYNQILPWLQSIAHDRMENDGLGGFNSMLRGLRSRATIVGLGFRISTMLTQISGFGPSLEMVSVKSMAGSLKDFVLSPLATTDAVMAKSSEMRHRMDHLDRDIRDQIRQLSGKQGVLDQVRKFAFTGIGYMDRVVAVPTWLAAYKDHLATHPGDEAGAIAKGDQVVALSQSSGGAKDLAAIMRGNEGMKLLTMFYSYFSAYYARQRNWGRDAARAIREGQFSDFPSLLARQVFMTMIPAVVGDLLVGKGPGDKDTWEKWAARKIAFYPFLAMPLVRAGASALDTGFGTDITPASRAIQEMFTNPLVLFGKLLSEDKHVTARDVVTQAIQTTGYALKLPTGQLATTTNNVWKAIEQDDFKLSDLVVTRQHKK